MTELPIDEPELFAIVRLMRKRLTSEERERLREVEREWFHRRWEQHRDRAA